MPTYGDDAGHVVTPHTDQTGRLKDIGLSSDPDPDPYGPTGSETRANRAVHGPGPSTWPIRKFDETGTHTESPTNAAVEYSRALAERGKSPGHDINLPKEGKK